MRMHSQKMHVPYEQMIQAAQASGRNQAEMPEGREQQNVIPDQADGKRSSEPKRAEGTKGSQRGGKGIRGAR
jgi:hypothetical protein